MFAIDRDRLLDEIRHTRDGYIAMGNNRLAEALETVSALVLGQPELREGDPDC